MFFCLCLVFIFFFFYKQKTAYEMRISDWSSDVCSSDLLAIDRQIGVAPERGQIAILRRKRHLEGVPRRAFVQRQRGQRIERPRGQVPGVHQIDAGSAAAAGIEGRQLVGHGLDREAARSEEHTSELQSLMRISYAVFCLKKKKTHK